MFQMISDDMITLIRKIFFSNRFNCNFKDQFVNIMLKSMAVTGKRPNPL